MRSIFAVVPLLAAGVSPLAMAAEDIVDPSTIIVMGAGNLAPSGGDRVLAQDVILDVQQGLGERVENRLRDAAGVVQFRRSDGRSAHPTSQGVTLRGLGGNASSRALVTLDGVPQADPFGGWVAWSAYDAVRLGGITIQRGGGSGADGAGALAGSIGLHSELGAGVAGSVAYGSRDSWDASLNLGGKLGAGEVAFDGRYARGDGFIPTPQHQRGLVDRAAAYEQGGAGLRARFDAGAHRRIEASLRAFHDSRDRGTDFTDSEIGGVDASLRMVDENPHGAAWTALAYVQLRELESGFASVGQGRNVVNPALFQRVPATGMGLRAEVRPLLNGARPLRVGADWRRTVGRTEEDYNFSGVTPARHRVAGGSSDVAGLFAEWSDGAGAGEDGLLWTVSGRLDHWRLGEGYRREGLIGGALTTNAAFDARSGWEGSGRAGLRWQQGDVALRGAVYRGWRLPTLNELYRPFRVGADTTLANEALSPERLWGGDIGLEWRRDGAQLSITGFANRLTGAIANVTILSMANTSRRENLDAVESKGVEVAAGYRIGPVRANLSYVFTDADVDASGTAAFLNGRRPAQIAKHGGSFSLYGNGEGPLGGFARLRYMGKQNEDDLGQLQLGDALTVDVGAHWRFAEGLIVELRGENIFDALVPASISSGGVMELTAPRSLWLGLRREF